MSLKTYRAKRKIGKTPEPLLKKELAVQVSAKNSKKRSTPLSFIIHEHHASRLHYDLRLELDGVLKSWAVPKGPPLSKQDKRLAIHVEDHPLSYGKFSGVIPKGNYGAGVVHIWDKGAYSSMETANRAESEKILRKEYEKGRLHLLMLGQKLKGLYTLVRTKDDQWLWMLKKDSKENLGNALRVKNKRDPFPKDIKPMLAGISEKAFNDQDWLFEIKWDGYRAVAEISENNSSNIKLYSRSGKDFTKTYKPITEALKQIGFECILDGEIIALNDKDQPEFQLLQNYQENPVKIAYAIFDILYIKGEDLRDRPLIERKDILKQIIPKDVPELVYSAHKENNGEKFFAEVNEYGGEGIMAKRKDSVYEHGRSQSWLKIKTVKRQETVICGYTRGRGSRNYFGALVLGVYENDELIYVGHTGTGFDDTSLKKIYKKLRSIQTRTSPFKNVPKTNMPVTWVKPLLVCEIKFTEWTKEGHMRHPVFMGLRDDKKGKEVRMSDIHNVRMSDIRITNKDKIFWPEKKYTKGDVIDYYEKIAPTILPYLKDRPQSLLRHPDGISGPGFFQKNVNSLNLPEFVQTINIRSEHSGNIKYLLCQNLETLKYIANLGCIELNPWNSKISALDTPDLMIIDLDPVNRPFSDVVKVAKATKEILDLACETCFCKTSGKRGLHIIVPLEEKYTYESIRLFSSLLVSLVHQKLPELTSLERSPSKRQGKVYLDWLQNRKGQTLAAPYSLRPTKDATVSTPIEWSELNNKLNPKKFTIETIFKRLKKKGDLWSDLFAKRTNLEESISCLKLRMSDIRLAKTPTRMSDIRVRVRHR